jgi:sugar lactone lactonase YvrE
VVSIARLVCSLIIIGSSILGLTLTAPVTCYADSSHLADDLRAVRARMDAADAAGKWDDERATTLEYLRLAPDNPRLLLRLALVEIRRGAMPAARDALDKFISLGLAFDASKEPEIAVVLTQPMFSRQAGILRRREKQVGKPRLVAALGQQPIVAEGIGFDLQNHRLLISTVATRAILEVDLKSGSSRAILTEAAAGGLFGIAIDNDGRSLWAAEASGPGIPRSEGGPGSTALVRVDLATGRIVKRLSLAPDEATRHQLNDVAVARDHTVFVADALSGEVYRLVPGSDHLEVLVPKGNLLSAQGMVITPDQQSLIVADYATGLHRVNLRTGGISLVHSRVHAALVGIDGLVRCGDALIATQNGTSPERVLQITLTVATNTVESIRVLAQGVTNMHDITLGSCHDNRYTYISGSQWANFDPDGKPRSSVFPSVAVMELTIRQ